MSNYIKGFNVNQMSFMPFSLDEMIEEDNPVRGINAIVDALNKDALNFNHSQTKSTGRPPYDPIVMFNEAVWGPFGDVHLMVLFS